MANKKGINIAKRINGIKKELDDIAAGYENLKNSNSNTIEKKIKLGDIDFESYENEFLQELQIKIGKVLLGRMKVKE